MNPQMVQELTASPLDFFNKYMGKFPWEDGGKWPFPIWPEMARKWVAANQHRENVIGEYISSWMRGIYRLLNGIQERYLRRFRSLPLHLSHSSHLNQKNNQNLTTSQSPWLNLRVCFNWLETLLQACCEVYHHKRQEFWKRKIIHV